MRKIFIAICFVAFPMLLRAQSGSISFYGTGASTTQQDGTQSSFTELVGAVSLLSPQQDAPGTEYAADLRYAGYPTVSGRSSRFSIFNAYIGQRFEGGWLVRGGQMWLNELGSLGSIGGAMAQWKHAQGSGFLRIGGFGGFEPEILQAGYTQGVHKFGGYLAFDGKDGRSHVVGYTTILNSGITERQVLTFSNFIPVQQKFTLYQTAEYDVTGPGGMGSGGLNYFFINGRIQPTNAVQIDGTYHHGRSIDARSITQDELNGVPVDPSALQGLLFESVDGRVTVTVARGVRVFGGYGRDTNNQGEAPLYRATAGFSISDLLQSGIDLNLSTSRFTGPNTYNAWTVSGGKTLGQKLYVSVDYSSYLSVFRFTSGDGIVIENRPQSKRLGFSANYNLGRSYSLLSTIDHTNADSYTETRVLFGISYRFH